ncbi:MAG: hypothetical protein GY820_03405 [Gammaproteobacteria bacterium]|nr:hypothetical protein [Gammaproteobacteria bacterium]
MQVEFDRSVIKVDYQTPTKHTKAKNINLFSILGPDHVPKEHLYDNLIEKLKIELKKPKGLSRLNYVSLFGMADLRIIQKTIFFLLTDYEINKNNAVIIVHPPDQEIIDNINKEILDLDRIIQNYKIHPLPIIRYSPEKDNIELSWIGIFENEDKEKLDQLLLEDFSLAVSDFIDPPNLKGNVVFTDEHGNVYSKLPNQMVLSKYHLLYSINLIKDAISQFQLLKSDGLYLCNGNYYQNQFLQLADILDSRIYRDVFASALFQKILNQFVIDNGYNIILPLYETTR